jgi:hypothetical protein
MVCKRMVDFAEKAQICRDRTRKARKDAIPHERGFMPVPPSDFVAPLSPIPKLASAARRLPIDIRHQEFRLIPMTLEHST